ncbi:MAG: flagellar motor switch protein FliN [Desulfobacterales bacterium]|nr:MAG: flagellar motor switch protein FliN [Desulfobacterales bacterium]
MNNLNNSDIRTAIIESILKIFDAAMSLDVEYTEIESPDSSAEELISDRVQFSGDVVGILRIRIPAELGRMMAARKGGIAAESLEGNEGIQDLLSDILLDIANDFKTVLTSADLTVEVSALASSTESGKQIAPKQMENYERLEFRHEQHTFQVDVGLNLAKQLPAADAENDLNENKNDAPLNDHQDLKSADDLDLDVILDIPIELTVELGRTKIPINELLQLGPGSAIPLSKLESEPVDILANDTLIARGQVVVQDEKYGIRVTEIASRMERIKSLS